MQPVVSPVGHSACNSCEVGDDPITEATPLVRFPAVRRSWGPALGFGALLALLGLGSTIAIYLMILQGHTANDLPPVDTPLLMVPRGQWSMPVAPPSPLVPPAANVLVVQTGTATCSDIADCTLLLQDLEKKQGSPLPYNFLVSGNGATFEALGWRLISPLAELAPPSLRQPVLVIGFIGNFIHEAPTMSQLEEAFAVIDTAVAERHLLRKFSIVGKVTQPGQIPTYLFDSLHTLNEWNKLLSDDD